MKKQGGLLARLVADLVLRELDRVEDDVELLSEEDRVRLDLEQLELVGLIRRLELALCLSLDMVGVSKAGLHVGDDVGCRRQVREVVSVQHLLYLV